MEFDKSRVYTALNADELKVGSKVICALSISDLKERVEAGEKITEVHEILSAGFEHRFSVYFDDVYLSYPLAYLISELEEKKLKWTDLKLGDVIKQKDGKISYLVIGIDSKGEDNSHILVDKTWIDDDCLCYWEKVEK